MLQIQLIDFGTPAFDEALALRNEILRIPLNLEFEISDINEEWDSYHFGCYDELNTLLGCLTLKPLSDGEIKMRQVAVLTNSQKRGIGKFLVEASEAFCQAHKFTKIVLHARKEAVPFYKKLSYKTQGKMFEEVGIPHYKMYKKVIGS